MGNVNLNQFGVVEKFRQDEFIFHEGELGAEMYIMLSGKADVYINSFDDMPIKVHELAAGDFFGEMALLEDLPRSASIYASEDILVLKIERKNFNSLISSRPDIAYKMMKMLSSRIRKTNEELTHREKSHKNEGNNDEHSDDYLEESGDSPCSGDRNLASGEENSSVTSGDMDENSQDMEETSNMNASQIDSVYLKRFEIASILPKDHKVYTYVPYDDFYDGNVLSKSVACPVCSDEFSADMVKNSRLQFSHEEKFFRKKFKNINPLVSMVWTCPRCFYSNYYYEFNTLTPYKLKDVKKALSGVNYNSKISNSKRDNINTIFVKYYMMLHIEENSRPSPIKLAKIWLNLYWLYEDVGDDFMKEYAFNKTQEYYRNAYYNCNVSLSKEEELRLGILVAELTGENGELEEAYRLLSKIIIDRRLSQILKNKASNLMYEYKNRIKEK